MEFHEKLQELRKRNGLTQEELAARLYVSRTAISKWESGRGFPNIESLKAIAKHFSVSLDELLSGEEIIAIAENDHREKQRTIRDLVFGLLDCGMALLLFLPLFGQETDSGVQAVSLLALRDVHSYLGLAYFGFIWSMVAVGLFTLALQKISPKLWVQCKRPLSLVVSSAGMCLFVMVRQPYAAVFVFAFLIIKVFLLLKRR